MPVLFLVCSARVRALFLLLLLPLLAIGARAAGQEGGERTDAPQRAGPQLQARFFTLLRAGDSVYSQRKGYESITGSLTYFNRAYALAQQTQDTLLLAEAVFAKGRVYDAWNKAPYRTIATLERAVALFARVPSARKRYYYARYLLVHAHDKVPDSVGTVRAARAFYRVLRAQPDSVLRLVPTTVELAWSCTEVGAYALADSVLRYLTRRADIRNDPSSYDHLTHYYLVRARIDLLHQRRPASAYLDSLDAAYQHLTNLFDHEYYSRNLGVLYAAVHQYRLAYERMQEYRHYSDSLEGRTEILELRQTLLESERRAEASNQLRETTARQRRLWLLAGLILGVGALAILSTYLYRQNHRARAQSAELTHANFALDEKVTQVELLNKEIQHRVKNNLHMIFSLLQMQERRTDNEEVIEHLQTARLRVESIASLHNQLQRDPAGLDLGPYLQGLISGVVGCLANDKHVLTHLQTDVLHLPERAYLPLSLILNEWVTNSIKYATPVSGALEISVSVRRQPTQVCIQYHDNGALPSGTARPGLGTQIVGLLSRQLTATLTVRPDQPFYYELLIPYDGELNTQD